MNENKEGTKLDLVNPMNPNQIIKSEILKKQIFIEKEEEQVIEKTKKKPNILLIVIISLVVIGLFTFLYIMYFDKLFKKPQNIEPNIIPTINDEIQLQDIINSFNNNITNYITDKEFEAQIVDNNMRITAIIEDETYTYDFIYKNNFLTVTVNIDETNIEEILRYVLSSIGEYYNTPFETTMAYLDDKELNTIQEITISQVNSLQVIKLDISKPIIKILD